MATGRSRVSTSTNLTSRYDAHISVSQFTAAFDTVFANACGAQ
jgi:hypothetical protein